MVLSQEKIKDDVKSKKDEQDFKYKKIKHTHETEPQCPRCDYEEREKEYKQKITDMSDQDTIKTLLEDNTEKILTFKSIKIHRGIFDDIIGYEIEWQ